MEVTQHHLSFNGNLNRVLTNDELSRLIPASFDSNHWSSPGVSDTNPTYCQASRVVLHYLSEETCIVNDVANWDEPDELADSSVPFEPANNLQARFFSAHSKRHKISDTPLYDLIAQPHQYLSPETLSATSKTRPTNSIIESAVKLFLQTDACVQLQVPYKRVAWIIPVRGKSFAHDDCTSASFAPSLAALFLPMPPQPEIRWRKETAQALWGFLQRLRKQQVFGALGFAFETHRPFDFIKVYHDAKHSLRLRTALGGFRHEEDIPPRGGRAYRPLKSAVLALVDEVNRGLLLA